MDYEFQKSSIKTIKELAKSNHHSILIEGISGSGKTYLAKMYKRLCNIYDFVIVEPTVQNIRDIIEHYYLVRTPAILCIENLDMGSSSAIGSILKFLEEPNHNVRIVITCRSRYRMPDTIASRCMVVSIPNPTSYDIMIYGKTKDSERYNSLIHRNINSILISFSDIDNLYTLTEEQLSYIDDTPTTHKGYIKKTINSTLWDFTHFRDNVEIPLSIIKMRIRYILHCNTDKMIRKMCLECLDELDNSRIATHVVLYKFFIDFIKVIS